MKRTDYEQLIVDGIKGLPRSRLAEITDFVYFVRERSAASKRIERALRQLSRDEEAHLEEEFRDYAKLYPRE